MNTGVMLLLLLPCLALLGASEARQVTGTITLGSHKAPRRLITKSLVLSNGLEWGEWGPVEYCPDGSFSVGAEAKFEPYGVLDTDETALNAVKLYCSTKDGLPTGYVTSTVGKKGEWQGTRSCDGHVFLTGMKGRVLEPQGILGDDVAVQNLQLECHHGLKILFLVENEKDADPESKIGMGEWGLWSSCPEESAVCGVETRLEDPNLIVDDTGVNDVSLFCCALKPAE